MQHVNCLLQLHLHHWAFLQRNEPYSRGDICTTDRIKGFVWYRRRFTPGPPPKCLKIQYEKSIESTCDDTTACLNDIFGGLSEFVPQQAHWQWHCLQIRTKLPGFYKELKQAVHFFCWVVMLFFFLDFPPCSWQMFRESRGFLQWISVLGLGKIYIHIFKSH